MAENTEVVQPDPDALPTPADPPAKEPELREPEPVKAEPEAPKEPEKKPNGLISDLQRERHRRREAEEKFTKAVERFEKLTGLLPQPAPAPAPDPNNDPLKWIEHTVNKAVAPVVEKVAKIETSSAEQAKISQAQALQSHVAALENQFRTEHPDYMQAAQHVRQVYANQFRAMGADDDKVETQLAQYTNWIVSEALNNGINPAEALYNIAKGIGYAPQAPTPVAPAMPTPTDPVSTARRGTEAPRTLSAVPGKSPAPGGISVQKLLEMDDNDFDQAVKGGNWDKLKRLLEAT